MLDRDGFRPNVGIILLNRHNQVFWGKRIRSNSWQFPQGGIDPGESPEQAMLRELHEEIGLRPEHVRVIGRTRDWLRYEVPDRYVRREARGYYRGQKQIWFLLQLLGQDSDMNLHTTEHPEFEGWRWHNYWVPLGVVIEFKRGVYQNALNELAQFLPQADSRNRFLRGRRRVPRSPYNSTETLTNADANASAAPHFNTAHPSQEPVTQGLISTAPIIPATPDRDTLCSATFNSPPTDQLVTPYLNKK